MLHLQVPQDLQIQGEVIDVESVINQRGMGTGEMAGEESMAANFSRNPDSEPFDSKNNTLRHALVFPSDLECGYQGD
jgi:hypothetical protein